VGSLRQLHRNHDRLLKFRGHDQYLLGTYSIQWDTTVDGFVWNWMVKNHFTEFLKMGIISRIGHVIETPGSILVSVTIGGPLYNYRLYNYRCPYPK
jgi:hypothetical protein